MLNLCVWDTRDSKSHYWGMRGVRTYRHFHKDARVSQKHNTRPAYESTSPPESTLVPLVALPPSPPALGDRSPPPSDFMLWSSSSNCACSLLSASRRGALWARGKGARP